jgi:hypothetical protein
MSEIGPVLPRPDIDIEEGAVIERGPVCDQLIDCRLTPGGCAVVESWPLGGDQPLTLKVFTERVLNILETDHSPYGNSGQLSELLESERATSRRGAGENFALLCFPATHNPKRLVPWRA